MTQNSDPSPLSNTQEINEFLQDKGDAAFAEEKYAMALAIYNKTLDYGPPTAELYEKIGDVLYSLERFQEALETYRKAIQQAAIDHEPEKTSLLRKKGDCYYSLEDYVEACVAYEQTILLDPDNVRVFCQLRYQLNWYLVRDAFWDVVEQDWQG